MPRMLQIQRMRRQPLPTLQRHMHPLPRKLTMRNVVAMLRPEGFPRPRTLRDTVEGNLDCPVLVLEEAPAEVEEALV